MKCIIRKYKIVKGEDKLFINFKLNLSGISNCLVKNINAKNKVKVLWFTVYLFCTQLEQTNFFLKGRVNMVMMYQY